MDWFNENILNEFGQKGAERKETNELVRSEASVLWRYKYIN
jgi:hypothetical protein